MSWTDGQGIQKKSTDIEGPCVISKRAIYSPFTASLKWWMMVDVYDATEHPPGYVGLGLAESQLLKTTVLQRKEECSLITAESHWKKTLGKWKKKT